MDFGGVGLRVASSAFVPLIKRLFRQDGPGAGLVERPVRLSALVTFRGEKRELVEQDLRKLSEELVRRALREMGPHDAPSTDHQREAADLLVRSLMCLGDLDMDDVQAVRLGHEELARRLNCRVDRWSSGPAAELHDRLLELACLHVLNFFTQRSTFVARTLVEQSRQLNDLTARMDLLLERVPLRSVEDARFEARYAEYVREEYGRLTIYGLDLHQEREWPLDDAYLSLEVRGREQERAGEATPQRAERALSGQERVLLRGLAGSGKTTLVQWLAVTTARADVRAGMTHLIGRVPFVLALRTLTRDGARLPGPDRFLAAMDCPLAAGQPDGWIDRVLAAGRALLLVDGIDEIPENERDAARRWLRGLKNAYPRSLWLVTARPSAVPDDWLASEGFAEYSLAAMSAGDVRAFVHRWHRAAGVGEEVERALHDLVHTRADLTILATNPLMCAMICALHRERNGHLPRGRKRLYDAALMMLLERRDRERPDSPRGRMELDAETQISLLQKLAYWLITNGRSEMTVGLATSVLEHALPLIHRGSELGSAHDVLRHLLERSGVLREPGPGAVDFVHRTFQDYLGAREIVDWQHFPMLVERAHEDQWEDVVRMAVAHAPLVQRGELLTQLAYRGDQEEPHRVRLHLLATACLEHATQLAPGVRQAIVGRATRFIPPRTTGEGQSLAQIGSIALELLPGPEKLSHHEAEMVVHAASCIASEAALTRLRAFVDHPSPGVRSRLAAAWSRFETDLYFKEIVSRLRCDEDVTFEVTSREMLYLVATLPHVSRVSVHGNITTSDVTAALGGHPITALTLRDNATLRGLGWLAQFEWLASLTIDTCPHITNLSELAEFPVRELTVYNSAGEVSLLGMGAISSLRSLTLGPGTHLSDSTLPHRAPLVRLVLPAIPPHFTDTEAWPYLTQLDLSYCHRPLWSYEWRSIAKLPNLRELGLHQGLLGTLTRSGVVLPHVHRVFVSEDTPHALSSVAEGGLAGTLPGLRELVLGPGVLVGQYDAAPSSLCSSVDFLEASLDRAVPRHVLVTRPLPSRY